MSSKKAAATGTEVATTTNLLPAPTFDFGEDFGDGLQDVGTDEVGIPFLKILQAQSPEVIGPQGKIDGAVAGVMLNTGTDELLDAITLVPAVRQHVFVEWRPRKDGGGIVAIHELGSDVVRACQDNQKFGEYKTEAGNDLVETFYVYAIAVNPETVVPTGMVVLAFSSMAIKNYKKRFMRRVKSCLVNDPNGVPKNPPMYSHRIVIGTQDEHNAKGTWKGFDISFAVENNVHKSMIDASTPAYQAAKALKAAVATGAAQADFQKDERSGSTEQEDGKSAF